MFAVESDPRMSTALGEFSDRIPVGRFAPSPTGDLHFGSLLAAVGSFLDARSRGGRWMVRIEDIDPPREVAGAAERQLSLLAHFGMIPDQPPTYQSHSLDRHEAAIARLLDLGKAYPCGCTRRDIGSDGIYPGTCRHAIPPGRRPRSVRFAVGGDSVIFQDRVLGRQIQKPAQQSGDFIIRRSDGLVAYQLAVVVDDAAAGVTDVVRGADLLDSTGRQIMLQRALGLPTPRYLHLPLVVDVSGRKLSKSRSADPVAARPAPAALALALSALGHHPPKRCTRLDSLWDWAFEHWNPQRIPQGLVSVQEDRIESYTRSPS